MTNMSTLKSWAQLKLYRRFQSRCVSRCITTVKLKIPGKAFLKSDSRTSVTFKASYILGKSATMKKLWKNTGRQLQVKNYNLNVTEVRESDLKNAFPGIFNFTVGILVRNFRKFYLKGFLPLLQSHILTRFGTSTMCNVVKFSSA